MVREDQTLVGILTRRDLKFLQNDQQSVKDVMTKDNLVTGPPGTDLDEAEAILNKHRVQKLLLVDKQGRLAGLITARDIERVQQYPNATKDDRGRLRVGHRSACWTSNASRPSSKRTWT